MKIHLKPRNIAILSGVAFLAVILIDILTLCNIIRFSLEFEIGNFLRHQNLGMNEMGMIVSVKNVRMTANLVPLIAALIVTLLLFAIWLFLHNRASGQSISDLMGKAKKIRAIRVAALIAVLASAIVNGLTLAGYFTIGIDSVEEALVARQMAFPLGTSAVHTNFLPLITAVTFAFILALLAITTFRQEQCKSQ